MPRWPDNCEWCNQYINGRTYSFEFTQDVLNNLFAEYNRVDPNTKAKIWSLFQRDNEWPKLGDKRGEFCSQRCLSQAAGSNFAGKWQSRGWFW